MKHLLLTTVLITWVSHSAHAQSFEWAKRMGGIDYEFANDIAIDAMENVHTIGSFSGGVDFDPGTDTYNLYPVGMRDVFISKLDAAGNFVWAKQIGGNMADCNGISVDQDVAGNMYVSGFFSDTVDFDPGPSTHLMGINSSDRGAFICKLDASGDFVWAKQLSGEGFCYAHSMAMDAAGNIHVTGSFEGRIDFDPGADSLYLTSTARTDAFVAKLDADGNLLWARQFSGTSYDDGLEIALDGAGNALVIGDFYATTDFDPSGGTFNLTSSSSNPDIFIAKLDPSGALVWAKQLGGTAIDRATSIAVDAAGNVYSTGYFAGIADFDPNAGTSNLTTTGNQDLFVSKLDASGNFVWAVQWGASGFDQGNSIAVDPAGNAYVTGYFSETVDFDPGPDTWHITAGGSRDAFISKLDASGRLFWAKQLGGAGTDEGIALTLDAKANVCTLGMFDGSVDFAPEVDHFGLTAAGGMDIFIHKMSPIQATATPTIYPNPSSNLLNIHIDDAIEQVTLYNALGAWVRSEPSGRFSVADLPAGMYILQIKTVKGSSTARFVKAD